MNLLSNKIIKEKLDDLEKKVENKILERNNFEFIKRMVEKCEDLQDAIDLCSIGTLYKNTGLYYDHKIEKKIDSIKYFKKNENLSFGKNPKHKLIIGDNYDILVNLQIEYKGKIDLIYIDPPYGMDENGEFAKTNYENRISRDNLLSMLRPRLELAKLLMSPEGIITCSIDDRNYAYLKCLFDEVFEEYNFVNTMVWHSNKSIMKGSKHIRKDHEYILVYAKNIDKTIFNKLSNKMEFSNPDNDPNGPWFSSNATYKLNPSSPNYYGIKLPNNEIIYRTWRFAKIDYDKGLIPLFFNGGNVPRIKLYEKDNNIKSSVPSTIIDDTITGILSEEGNLTTAKNELIEILGKDSFETPKPLSLMLYILNIMAKNDSIVLDFFAGSGTMGHAVLEFNRNTNSNCTFIMATNNELGELYPNGVAYDVTYKRLKNLMDSTVIQADSKWLKYNKSYNLPLLVIEIANEPKASTKIFEKVNEDLYGIAKLNNKEKIEWVCENFEKTALEID
jgi:adenine-specific DNA-methyltransferase